MKIELLCRGMVESNCYALENDGEAVLIDAGAHPDDIDAALKKRGLRLRAILLTHGHFDHILGAEAIAEESFILRQLTAIRCVRRANIK